MHRSIRTNIVAFAAASFALAGVAHAQEEGGGGYFPKAKDMEISFATPPLFNSGNLTTGATRGFGVSVESLNGGSATTVGFGINGGVGYFITDMIEVGGVLAVDIASVSGGGNGLTAYAFGVEPFVKFSLGNVMKFSPRINPFILAGLGIGLTGVGNGSTGVLFAIEANPGIEFYLTKHWALTAFVPLALELNGAGVAGVGGGTAVIFNIGIGYGISLYF